MKRLRKTEVLVIDEISMVENNHFERLNCLMKEARGNRTAFGGVQLIVTGDFCQLPPVKPFEHCVECGRQTIINKARTEYKCRKHGIFKDIDKWAFRSEAWEECNFAHVNLTQINRQNDMDLINILNKLRMGIRLLPEEEHKLLNHPSETRNAIQLFATKDQVNNINEERFMALRSIERTFNCLDHLRLQRKHEYLKKENSPTPDGGLLKQLEGHRFESQIKLKKGMLVVLVYNLDLRSGLVNGSQGIIQGFEEYDPMKLPKTVNRREPIEGITHGDPILQGEYSVFREGQVEEYAKQMEFKAWPIVRYVNNTRRTGIPELITSKYRFMNGVNRTIYAECAVTQLGEEEPYSLLSRAQTPLMAAWAITVHKSQGMTLNRVIVDLSRCFEEGQAYVALSRARTLDGLRVVSFPRSAQGRRNRQVKDFLRERFNLNFNSQES